MAWQERYRSVPALAHSKYRCERKVSFALCHIIDLEVAAQEILGTGAGGKRL